MRSSHHWQHSSCCFTCRRAASASAGPFPHLGGEVDEVASELLGPAHLLGMGFHIEAGDPSPPGTGEDEVDIVRAAGGADEPLVPVADGGIGDVTGGLCGGIRLGLAAAGLAPHDQPDLSRSGPSQRHRRTAVGLHRPRLWRVLALGGS